MTAAPGWKVERTEVPPGYALEWHEPGYCLLSNENRLFRGRDLTPPYEPLGVFPAAARRAGRRRGRAGGGRGRGAGVWTSETRLSRGRALTPPYEPLGVFPAPAWRSVLCRMRPAQRLLRFLFYNVLRMRDDVLFATFDRGMA